MFKFKKIKNILIWFLSAVFVFLYIIPWIPLPFFYKKEPIEKASVIFVLGSGVEDDGTLSFAAKERVEEGLRLCGEYSDAIIFTGGKVPGFNYIESETMYKYAQDLLSGKEKVHRGKEIEIAEKENCRFFLEDKSTSTFENAKFSKDIYNKNNFQSCIIATSSFHSRRSDKTFEKAGLNCQIHPVTRDFYFSLNPYYRYFALHSAYRENMAWVFNLVRGRVDLYP